MESPNASMRCSAEAMADSRLDRSESSSRLRLLAAPLAAAMNDWRLILPLS
ncbi:hypothetical protein D3C85_1482540 [compost metagenome]